MARAYNNWLHDRYLKASPRLKGMALLPLQDVEEAVKRTGNRHFLFASDFPHEIGPQDILG